MNHNVVRGVLVCFAVSSCKGCFDFGSSENDEGGCGTSEVGYDGFGSADSADAGDPSCLRCGNFILAEERSPGALCETDANLASQTLFDTLQTCACVSSCWEVCVGSCGRDVNLSPACLACAKEQCVAEVAACAADISHDLDASVQGDANQDDAELSDGSTPDALSDGDVSEAAGDAELEQ